MARIFLLLLFLYACNEAELGDLRQPVVIVESGGETGAAIVVGHQGNHLYLLTAAHVIVDPDDIDITFRGNFQAKAEVVNSDQEIDLAAIRCLLPIGMQAPASFALAAGAVPENDEVIVIGHPLGNDWDINRQNHIKANAYGITPGKFTIYTLGIAPGSSGGPVLNKQQALYGLVTQTDQVNTICLHADVLKQACQTWGVSQNLLMGLQRMPLPTETKSIPSPQQSPSSTARSDSAVPSLTEEPQVTSYTDSLVGEMILVKGHSFMMGSENGESDEKPVHQVKVRDFYIGKHEVTQAQWKAIMGENPSYYKDCDQCPVESVSWGDVQQYIQKLNEKTGQTYRLPTEAEWEYASGGGASGRAQWAGTNSKIELANYAWYSKNSDDKTHPVGEKKKNSLGLSNMSGNVWEWCQDWYHDSYQNAPTDGSSWDNPVGSRRVVRGGGWNSSPTYCRVAFRGYRTLGRRYIHVGFRLSRTL